VQNTLDTIGDILAVDGKAICGTGKEGKVYPFFENFQGVHGIDCQLNF